MRFKKHRQYRLPYFNYASSALYFVTICCENRNELFGTIKNGVMTKSWIGEIVESCLNRIPLSSPYAFLDSFVIMPDHVHAIIGLDNPDEQLTVPIKIFVPGKKSLSIVVRNFKSAVTIFVRRDRPGMKIWQSRFYDRIIRNEKELHAIRKYIADNPLNWSRNKNDVENNNM